MQSDRELLEAAAKAAGHTINARAQAERDAITDPSTASLWINDVSTAWNPLTDDGDALRLAVKLQLRVIPPEDEFGIDRASVRIAGVRDLVDAFDPDPYAATRRAIVRAAAAMANNEGQEARG